MIEGDAQAASQEKAEEKDGFTRGFAPASLTPSPLSLTLSLFFSHGHVHTVPSSFSTLALEPRLRRYYPLLVLADLALARPRHLPPLDLNPIYLSTVETLRIFAWLAHSNFLADA